MCGRYLFLLLCAVFLTSLGASAAECRKVRFADTRWTDIAASTAVATEVLGALGYEPKTIELSVPVTYSSLKNGDIDVFLGTWIPSMAESVAPFLKNHSIEQVGTVLKGARYTLAVPKFVYDAGVRHFSDLAKYKDRFHGKIYGIEPGNDGNHKIQKMISENIFGLGGWKIIESSEQPMFLEAIRAAKYGRWIVFLAWEPHPINQRMDLAYLDGGDQYFGPYGGATVYIHSRRNYSKQCPQVAKFLEKFSLTIESQTSMMSMILDQGLEPRAAARKWIQANLNQVLEWVSDVDAISGKAATTAVSEKFKTG